MNLDSSYDEWGYKSHAGQIKKLKAELAKSEEDVDVLCRKLSECQQQLTNSMAREEGYQTTIDFQQNRISELDAALASVQHEE